MLALLAIICAGGVKAQTEQPEVTLNFNDAANPWNLPEEYIKDGKLYEYSYGGITISLQGTANKNNFGLYKNAQNVYYLQLHGSGVTLTLPQFDFVVSKIELEMNLVSKSLKQNVYVNGKEASTSITGITGDATFVFDIKEEYQKSNVTFQLKNSVAAAKIEKIKIYKKSDKKNPKITFSEVAKTVDFEDGAIVSMSDIAKVLTNPNGLPISYTCDATSDVAEISDNTLFIYKEDTPVKVTASFVGNDEYDAATATMTIIASRKDAGILFESNSYTVDTNKGEFNGAVLVNPNNLPVTYSINADNKSAWINETSGIVTYNRGTKASYVVTATFAGNKTYKPTTATYTLNVVNVDNMEKTVTFIAGIDKGTGNNTNKITADKIIKDGIEISSGRACLGFSDKSYYAFYKTSGSNKGETTITTTMGSITKIAFEAGNGKEPDKITFSEGKYSKDADGTKNYTWSGNAKSVTFTATASTYISKITITLEVAKEFTLDEDKEVNEIEDGKEIDVTVKRTFYKDGDWNTLCLPFDVSEEEVKTAFGSDAKLRQVDEANSKGNTVAFTEANAIKAGVPYLIKFNKVAENADQPQEFNHTFEGVTLIKKVEYIALADMNIIFAGSYPAFTPEDFLKEYDVCDVVASMAAANTLKKVNAGTTIKGLRAVFGLASSVQPQAVKVVIDGTTTGIGDLHVDGSTVANGRVYNLNGQCVGTSLEGLKAGVYIQNGKKVMINK